MSYPKLWRRGWDSLRALPYHACLVASSATGGAPRRSNPPITVKQKQTYPLGTSVLFGGARVLNPEPRTDEKQNNYPKRRDF